MTNTAHATRTVSVSLDTPADRQWQMGRNREDRPADPRAAAMVAIAQEIAMDWLVPIHDAATLTAVANVAHGHNDFEPLKVAAALLPFVDGLAGIQWGTTGAGPLIVLDLAYWTTQRIDEGRGIEGPRRKFSEAERIELTEQLIRTALGVHAASVRVRQGGPRADEWEQRKAGANPTKIRLWWD